MKKDTRQQEPGGMTVKEMAAQLLPGMKWALGNEKRWDIRIMTICDGYVMAKHRNAMPFVLSRLDFAKRILEGFSPIADDPNPLKYTQID